MWQAQRTSISSDQIRASLLVSPRVHCELSVVDVVALFFLFINSVDKTRTFVSTYTNNMNTIIGRQARASQRRRKSTTTTTTKRLTMVMVRREARILKIVELKVNDYFVAISS